MKNNVLIYLILAALTAAGCKKTPQGITGTVTGIVRDTITSIPVANAKITVGEYKYSTYGYERINTVGVATTGADGKYNLKFTTTGQGIGYMVQCNLDSIYANFNGTIKVNAGKDNAVNFGVIKLVPVQARIIVTNNPYPPLNVYLGPVHGYNIYGTSNDTTITLLVFPFNYSQLQFSINIPGQNIPTTVYKDIYYSTAVQTFNIDSSTFNR